MVEKRLFQNANSNYLANHSSPTNTTLFFEEAACSIIDCGQKGIHFRVPDKIRPSPVLQQFLLSLCSAVGICNKLVCV